MKTEEKVKEEEERGGESEEGSEEGGAINHRLWVFLDTLSRSYFL